MSKKILIIEDEEALAKNLELAFGREFEIFLAGTGREGLKMVKEKKPDLILLDVMLPDIDGNEILKKIKVEEKTMNIPVIVLTNLGDQETVSRILQAGGTQYLVKSDWSLDEVVGKAKEALE